MGLLLILLCTIAKGINLYNNGIYEPGLSNGQLFVRDHHHRDLIDGVNCPGEFQGSGYCDQRARSGA